MPDLFSGRPIIKSPADVGINFELVGKVKVFPVEQSDLIALAIPAIMTALPLLRTNMPLAEIIENLPHASLTNFGDSERMSSIWLFICL